MYRGRWYLLSLCDEVFITMAGIKVQLNYTRDLGLNPDGSGIKLLKIV